MELDKLLKMKNSLEIFKSAINEVSNVKCVINNDTDKNENGNITDLIRKYNAFFSDNFLLYLTQDIEKIISEITNKLNITCEHEVITDYIDVFPDRCLPIKYCTKCNITL